MALQYSVPFCVAIALLDDVDDPLAFGERALGNPQVHALAARSYARHGRTRRQAGRATCGSHCATDARSSVTAMTSRHAERPLSSAQLRAKFLRCAGEFAHAQALLEQLEAIASVPDVATLPLA